MEITEHNWQGFCKVRSTPSLYRIQKHKKWFIDTFGLTPEKFYYCFEHEDELKEKFERVLTKVLTSDTLNNGGDKVQTQTQTQLPKFTHIRLLTTTKQMLDQVKAIGQTYDGAIQELVIEKKRQDKAQEELNMALKEAVENSEQNKKEEK